MIHIDLLALITVRWVQSQEMIYEFDLALCAGDTARLAG